MHNQTWNDAILEAMQNLGGEKLTLREIYTEMTKSPLVTSYHCEAWRDGKQPRYVCWINKYLSTLVKKGMVSRVRTGTYSLISN